MLGDVPARARRVLRTVEAWHVDAALLVAAILAIAVPGLLGAPPGERAVGQESTEETTAAPVDIQIHGPPLA